MDHSNIRHPDGRDMGAGDTRKHHTTEASDIANIGKAGQKHWWDTPKEKGAKNNQSGQKGSQGEGEFQALAAFGAGQRSARSRRNLASSIWRHHGRRRLGSERRQWLQIFDGTHTANTQKKLECQTAQS